jgi:pilus assembly protein TadC
MVTQPDTRPVTTPETISDLAAQADLGTLDQKTALIIKLCEAKAENKASSTISSLQTNLATLRERYKALLRELRDKLQSIKFDDFVKIIIGLLGGFVIRAITQQGIKAFEDKWVGISIFFFIICLVFLIIRYLAPSKRKKELDKELQILNGEKKQ